MLPAYDRGYFLPDCLPNGYTGAIHPPPARSWSGEITVAERGKHGRGRGKLRSRKGEISRSKRAQYPPMYSREQVLAFYFLLLYAGRIRRAQPGCLSLDGWRGTGTSETSGTWQWEGKTLVSFQVIQHDSVALLSAPIRKAVACITPPTHARGREGGRDETVQAHSL